MAFSDFKTIADVQKKYRIKHKQCKFIIGQDLTLSEFFVKDFAFNNENIDVFSSEAARSEIVISPLLREVYKNHYHNYSFWIQKSIFFDHILQGTPDYIFAQRSELGRTVLEKPIVIVVEAKKNDFVQGWGQCLAELVAAYKINDNPQRSVYGIVTDANMWQFGKFREDTFTQDPESFTVYKLSTLYGALEYLLQTVEQENSGNIGT